MDCYILHTVLLVIILLFINAIICKTEKSKLKNVLTCEQIKMEHNEF